MKKNVYFNEFWLSLKGQAIWSVLLWGCIHSCTPPTSQIAISQHDQPAKQDTVTPLSGSFFDSLCLEPTTTFPNVCPPPNHRRRITFDSWNIEESDEFIIHDSLGLIENTEPYIGEDGWKIESVERNTYPKMFSEWYLKEEEKKGFWSYQ